MISGGDITVLQVDLDVPKQKPGVYWTCIIHVTRHQYMEVEGTSLDSVEVPVISEGHNFTTIFSKKFK